MGSVLSTKNRRSAWSLHASIVLFDNDATVGCGESTRSIQTRSLRSTSLRCSSNSIDSWLCDDLRSTNRRRSNSIDPNPIAAIDEDARVALAAHKEIDNSGRYTHVQD